MKINKKLVVPVVLTVVLLSAIAISQVAGVQGGKTSVYSNNQWFLPADPEYADEVVATASIKTGNHADLVISFTSEAILMTDTKITGKPDKSVSTSEDVATIKVWAVVLDDEDNVECDLADPGKITFAHRLQRLSGRLNMMHDPDSDGSGWSTSEPQWVQLKLNTTNANGFNFLALDLPDGTHTVEIHASVVLTENEETNDEIWGALGKRTLVVQQVRDVN